MSVSLGRPDRKLYRLRYISVISESLCDIPIFVSYNEQLSPRILGVRLCGPHKRTPSIYGPKIVLLAVRQNIKYYICMKTITINVSEPVYKDFKKFAKQRDRTTSELIRAAMEEYCQHHIHQQTSLKNVQPVSVGKVLKPLTQDDDFLGEMLYD